MDPVQSIKNSLLLTKSLLVSSIIIGEPYSGKLEFIRSIFSDAVYIDANNIDKLNDALLHNEEIVIYNFETIKDIEKLNFNNKRVIAIASKITNMKDIEKKFAFIYHFPPLRERLDDVKTSINKFKNDIKDDLMIDKDFSIDISKLDLSQNYKSLKISLYKEFIKKSLSIEDIKQILFDYFLDNLSGKNEYKENLHIFEAPLIEAGLKRYKSQLKLADVLGLNRNTLRKKINEHGIH